MPPLVVPRLVVPQGPMTLAVNALEWFSTYSYVLFWGQTLLLFCRFRTFCLFLLFRPFLSSAHFPYLCPPMSDLERLIDHYSQDAVVKSLQQALLANQAQVQVTGLAGSGKSFVLSGLVLNGCGPWLLISPDKEAAAYLPNTLSSLLPDADVM